MQTNIRALKANLSEVIRKVEAGATVTVSVRNRRVARIVPIGGKDDVRTLAGIRGLIWSGGKPAGVGRAERLPADDGLAARVVEDRR